MPGFFNSGNGGFAATGSNLTGLNATNGFTIAFWMRPWLETGIAAGDLFRHADTANSARNGYAINFSSGGMQVLVLGSAASTTSTFSPAVLRMQNGDWAHWVVTFDDTTDAVLLYKNGVLISRATNTRDMTSVASTTTTFHGTASQGSLAGYHFDLQILPDVVVPAHDVPLLMSPSYKHPGVKGRYHGREFRDVAQSSTFRDESGNGNNLVPNSPMGTTPEPPLAPTFG